MIETGFTICVTDCLLLLTCFVYCHILSKCVIYSFIFDIASFLCTRHGMNILSHFFYGEIDFLKENKGDNRYILSHYLTLFK